MLKNYILGIGFVCSTLFFIACSPNVSLVIHPDDSASVQFTTNSSTTLESLVRSLTGISPGVSVFDKAKIQESFFTNTVKTAKGTPALQIKSLSLSSTANIDINVHIEDIDMEFLPGISPITLEKTNKGTAFRLLLSAQTVQSAMRLMPEETNDFIELLMAPVFTGEKMSEDAYANLLTVVYGMRAANELRSAKLTLTVSAPDVIKSARISKPSLVSFTQKNAVFTIPLTTLLTMENPIECAIEWR